MPAWESFACPACHTALVQRSPDELFCPAEGLSYPRRAGIWRFLAPDRAAYFRQFALEYETIRRAEGRGSPDAVYYRALPYKDLSEKMPTDWRIRARSFDLLVRRVLAPLEKSAPHLAVLDLGAGNGWLSNRLARRGHHVAAVDLLDNDFDGLGCARFYDSLFSPVQAEFDRLPFPDGSADLVIFNASLHSSTNIPASLAQALHVLAPNGRLVILDSPVYHAAGSGEKMVREREELFRQRYGFPSNALPSENYLTYDFLKALQAPLGVRWKFLTPFYGFAWMLRPLKARLRSTREPAKFHLIVAQKTG